MLVSLRRSLALFGSPSASVDQMRPPSKSVGSRHQPARTPVIEFPAKLAGIARMS